MSISRLEINLSDRAPISEIHRQKELLLRTPFIAQILDAFPECAGILNSYRQIVLANSALVNAIEREGSYRIEGTRLGEHMRCANALESEDGCGTAVNCQTCGALIAILVAQNGKSDVEECRLSLRTNGVFTAVDFKVYTSPITIEGEHFTIVSLVDVSGEKRRHVLERIFFHDVNNTAGGIFGLSKLLPLVGESVEREEIIERISFASKQLLSEIETQRDLLAAENDELSVKTEKVSLNEILNTVKGIHQHHSVAERRFIDVANTHPDETIVTDRTQVIRSIGNLTKNALEAIKEGETVTMDFSPVDEDMVRLTVHNPGVIPREVEMQIFLRSFSTKGEGRGIGTYSVKLIVERYLQGAVGFNTSSEDGTEFYILLPRTLLSDFAG